MMPAIERRACPPEYQARLTQAVGYSRTGEPNFIIAWGQTITYQAGGVWPKPHGDGHFGYRPLMLSNSSPSGRGTPCWMILEWHPPEDYENDAVYYFRNRDDVTGLQILGEFPYRGRYEIAFKLTSTDFRDGRLQVAHYHLDGMILDMLIPAIVEGQKMTMKQRLERLRKYEEKKEKDLDRNIDAVLNGAKRRLLPSQIDDRVRLIQQQMGTMLKTFGRVQPGFQINKMHAA
jgi:hypothetical protein